MRRKGSLVYSWNRFTEGVQNFLLKALVALSFIMIIFYFGYIVYYSIVCYDVSRIITGCVLLCVLIHLNKSLQGR